MSVGALITWPYKPGGRSRRGSPKAGTTVHISFLSSTIVIEFELYAVVLVSFTWVFEISGNLPDAYLYIAC